MKHAKHLPAEQKAALRTHRAVQRILCILSEYNKPWTGTALANTLYAHALLHHGNEQVIDIVLNQLKRPDLQLSSQDVVSLAYALALSGIQHQAFVTRLDTLLSQHMQESSVHWLLDNCSIKDLCLLAWSVSKITTAAQGIQALRSTLQSASNRLLRSTSEHFSASNTSLTMLAICCCYSRHTSKQL